MRRVIFNRKGGVGKSSIAVNLAAVSALSGRPTLVVDLDPQCNATQYILGEAVEDLEETVADFFTQYLSFRLLPEPIEEFIYEAPYRNLAVLPASPELADVQGKLEAKYKIYKLRDALNRLGDTFEAVYIDTPPSFNFYTLSALIAADSCLIPFDCDEFARQALYTLLDDAEEVREDHNEELFVEGIIVNDFNARANLPARLVGALREEGLPVADTLLPASVKMRESHERACPLIYMAPSHKLTRAFVQLHEELIAP